MLRTGKKHKNQSGFALVVTILVTAILITVVVEFAYNVYVSTARAANFSNSQRASVLAGVGVELAQSALKEILKVRPNIVLDPEGLTFTKKDGGMTVILRAVDELSKVSTGVVYPATGVDNDRVRPVFTRLVKNLELDERLVDTLSDWIDSNDEPRVYGAEGPDYYRTLPRPYGPGNGELASLEELGMVKDYTKGVVDTLRPYISPYNTSGFVNINTAPKEVIMALDEEITAELADEIITFRKENAFHDRSDVMKVTGFETIGFNLQDKIVVQTDIFRVYSKAIVDDTVREVEAVVTTGGKVLYWREF